MFILNSRVGHQGRNKVLKSGCARLHKGHVKSKLCLPKNWGCRCTMCIPISYDPEVHCHISISCMKILLPKNFSIAYIFRLHTYLHEFMLDAMFRKFEDRLRDFFEIIALCLHVRKLCV